MTDTPQCTLIAITIYIEIYICFEESTTLKTQFCLLDPKQNVLPVLFRPLNTTKK